MNIQNTQDTTDNVLLAGPEMQPESEEAVSNSVKALDIILDNALLGHTADKKAYACLTNSTVTPLESRETKEFLMYHFH